MRVTVLVGTVKGAFLLTSDERRQEWKIEGPLFKGWKVSAASIGIGGGFVAATSSFVYGAAIHKSDDLREWRQVEAGPRYEKDSGFELKEIWTVTAAGDRLYAGVDEAGLFRSDDAGETWQCVRGLSGHPSRGKWFPGFGGLCAHHVLVDPHDARRIWVGISAVGVFRSDDFGETWAPKNEGVPCIIEDAEQKDIGYCVHAIVADPANANHLFRQDHRGMFRSENGGDTWETIENGLPSTFGFPIAIDDQTRALYSVPLESDEYRMPPEGKFAVYRSTDGGDSWQAQREGLPQEAAYMGVLRKALALDQLSPCGVYVGTTAGTVHLSNDGGDTWQSMPWTLPRILTVEAFVEA